MHKAAGLIVAYVSASTAGVTLAGADGPAEDGALAVTAGTPDVAPPLTVDSARRSLWSDYDARACAKPWFASLSGKRK